MDWGCISNLYQWFQIFVSGLRFTGYLHIFPWTLRQGNSGAQNDDYLRRNFGTLSNSTNLVPKDRIWKSYHQWKSACQNWSKFLHHSWYCLEKYYIATFKTAIIRGYIKGARQRDLVCKRGNWTLNCPSRWSLYLPLALCFDHSNREKGTAMF